MHALIRHYHAFSLLRRAIRPSLPSIICSFIMHPIPSAGSSKASSQLHSDCLAPSGSSLISIPLLLFLFIAFHFLFYIITYLFRVPQGVILSILLIYFNLLYFKTENLHNLSCMLNFSVKPHPPPAAGHLQTSY